MRGRCLLVDAADNGTLSPKSIYHVQLSATCLVIPPFLPHSSHQVAFWLPGASWAWRLGI